MSSTQQASGLFLDEIKDKCIGCGVRLSGPYFGSYTEGRNREFEQMT